MHILWMKTELLHPVDKGGKIRTYHMLRAIKALGHRITYLTLDAETDDEAHRAAAEYCDHLITVEHTNARKFSFRFFLELARNMLSSLPYSVAKYRSVGMAEELAKLLNTQNVDLIVCDFLAPSANLLPAWRKKSVLFQHNVEAQIWKRHYQTQRNWLAKTYLWLEWVKMVRYERKACHDFGTVVAVSQDDAEMFGDMGARHVSGVATGVDLNYFAFKHKQTIGHRLVFTGSMDWLPNHDAMVFFIESVLPKIRSTYPDVSLTIVGRAPYPALISLANATSGVHVTGRVDDVRPYIEDADIFIVPIRIGGGTRLKVYEAMAVGRPVVSTTIGVEGLPVSHGRELLVADTPQAMAEAITTLFDCPHDSERLARQAATLVREKFGWSGVASHFVDILTDHRMRQHSSKMDADTIVQQRDNEGLHK